MPARPQKEPPIEVMAGMEPGVEERNSAVAKLFPTEQKMRRSYTEWGPPSNQTPDAALPSKN